MKIRTFVVAGALVGSLVSAGAVSAESCEITGTGPDSDNTCTFTEGQSCFVTNDNHVFVNNSNQQDSQSGDANSSGNTTGGGASSGTGTNQNNVKITGTIDNSGACNPPVVPVTPTTPQPPAGGSGGGQVQSAQTTAPQVKVPVGGVGAGAGGSDTSAVMMALLAVGSGAIALGLRRLQRQS